MMATTIRLPHIHRCICYNGIAFCCSVSVVLLIYTLGIFPDTKEAMGLLKSNINQGDVSRKVTLYLREYLIIILITWQSTKIKDHDDHRQPTADAYFSFIKILETFFI